MLETRGLIRLGQSTPNHHDHWLENLLKFEISVETNDTVQKYRNQVSLITLNDSFNTSSHLFGNIIQVYTHKISTVNLINLPKWSNTITN